MKLTTEEQIAFDWIKQRGKPQMADFRREFGWDKGTDLIHSLGLKALIAYDKYSRLFIVGAEQ